MHNYSTAQGFKPDHHQLDNDNPTGFKTYTKKKIMITSWSHYMSTEEIQLNKKLQLQDHFIEGMAKINVDFNYTCGVDHLYKLCGHLIY